MVIFLKDKAKKNIINEAFDIVDNIVKKTGFHRAARDEWIRKWGWKTDSVSIIKKWGNSICINFAVYIPARNGSDLIFEDIAIDNLFQMLGYGNSLSCIEVPTFVFFFRSFKKKILNAMKKGLPWFEQFDTPQKCWQYVQDNTRKPNIPAWGYKCPKVFLFFEKFKRNGRKYIKAETWKNPNSEAFKHCKAFLNSLPAELEENKTPVKIMWEYPNEYSRALFDLEYDKPLPEFSEDDD